MQKKNKVSMEDLTRNQAEVEAETEVETKADGQEYDPEIYAETPQTLVQSKTSTFPSHLFKLVIGLAKKNVGLLSHDPDTDPQEFRDCEHVHFLRTRDSDGKVPISTQKLSNRADAIVLRTASIAGHFHLVELVPNADPTKPPVVTAVSGPMTMTKKKIKGKWASVEGPANEYDEHKHKVQYLETTQVQARVKNTEAAKTMAFEAVKSPKSLPGVIG